MGDVEPRSAGVPYPVATEPARFELAEDMQTAFGPIVAAYLEFEDACSTRAHHRGSSVCLAMQKPALKVRRVIALDASAHVDPVFQGPRLKSPGPLTRVFTRLVVGRRPIPPS